MYYIKAAIDKRKNINVCSSNEVNRRTHVKIGDLIMSALIDTGADVSPMSNKYAKIFGDRLETCHVTLKRIVPGLIESTQRFTVETEITGTKALITYHLVPEGTSDYDVIIDNDLYNDRSLVPVTDYNGSKVTKRQLPGLYRVMEGETVDGIDIPEEYRPQLLELLQNYREMITSGNRVAASKTLLLKLN